MTTLYESILSSTKSGANREINDKILKSYGFKLRPKEYGGNMGMYEHEDTKASFKKTNKNGKDCYAFSVYFNNKLQTKIIKTIKDLELVINFQKAVKNFENLAPYKLEFEKMENL